MTNGDIIRHMSDMEIAKLLVFGDRCSMCNMQDYEECGAKDSCWRGVESWLKEEEKDEVQ